MGILTFTIVALACILAALGAPSANADTVAGLSRLISETELSEGQRSPALYPHLRQLGLRLQESGDYASSIQPFRHMQHLVHANSGVYSTLQSESVEHLIRSFVAMGDFQAAETQHRFLYDLTRRAHSAEDTEMLVARLRLADWYRSTARPKDALRLYGEARLILEREGADVFHLVRVLRSEALTLYVAGRCCASDKLERINDIVSHHDAFDVQDKQRAAFEYLEMLIIEQKVHEAGGRLAIVGTTYPGAMVSEPKYLGLQNPRSVVKAIDSLKLVKPHMSIPGRDAGNDLILFKKEEAPLPAAIGTPVPICSATIKDYIRGDRREELNEYYVDVALNVDAQGRASNISLAGNTPSRLVRYLRAVLEQSRYKPAISTNGAMAEGVLTFRQTFTPDNSNGVADDLAGWNALMSSQSCMAAMDHGNVRASMSRGIL